ncbi:MAG: hypothetical protein EBT47_08660 [Chloroflexi bacterium]|nr:hypothetical protein [Chloroflexota bacterium]
MRACPKRRRRGLSGAGSSIECYGSGERSWLIVCGHPSHPSVHVSDQRPGRPSDDVTPLLLRLRKLVDGALVTAVTQPRGERIIHIDFAGKSEDGPYGVTLIVELLGPGTTVILVDEHGMILECSRRLGLGPKAFRTGEVRSLGVDRRRASRRHSRPARSPWSGECTSARLNCPCGWGLQSPAG